MRFSNDTNNQILSHEIISQFFKMSAKSSASALAISCKITGDAMIVVLMRSNRAMRASCCSTGGTCSVTAPTLVVDDGPAIDGSADDDADVTLDESAVDLKL